MTVHLTLQTKDLYGYAIKSMDDCISFQRILFFFLKVNIPNRILLKNRHILNFNGHGSHVTFEAIEQAQTFKLDMVTLLSHTSHALQPLDVVCFKPFKTTFRKEKETTMINRNYIELNKIVSAR
jgi:hypothetical protein